MAYCRQDTPPSSNQEAVSLSFHLRFLSLETYHISGREGENIVSAPNSPTTWHGVSASLSGLTYLSLPKRQNSLTEIPVVGYHSFPLAEWVIFKIANSSAQYRCESSKCCYGTQSNHFQLAQPVTDKVCMATLLASDVSTQANHALSSTPLGFGATSWGRGFSGNKQKFPRSIWEEGGG